MSRLLTTTLIAPIAAAALCLSLSGCGDSSNSSTASSSASSSSSTSSSSAPSSADASTSASTEATANATAEAGTLAAVCTQIDAVMEGEPDADPAGTAKKLEDIKAEVTTTDADLIEALAAAYGAIAENPSAPTQPVADSAKALGAACQNATTAPQPN
ncbi:MAG: hypothetical protein KDB71_12550 [Mycobacterium sp.]|nr:hypothetical protein [Mycobacterium sp.]